MRTILMALILGTSVAAAAAPALADDDRGEGGQDRFVAVTDRDTPQINLSVVAGTDEDAPALPDRYEKN